MMILWFRALHFSSEDMLTLLPVQAHWTVFIWTHNKDSSFKSHLKTHMFPISNS